MLGGNLFGTFQRSRNIALKAYQLSSCVRRDQKTAQGIHDHVEKLGEQWRAEELADPHLRERRLVNVRRAWKIMDASEPDASKIMRWRVQLYCGHIVATTRHIENAEPTIHGSSSAHCSVCGKNPARMVPFEPIGPLGQSPNRDGNVPGSQLARQPSRKQLEDRITQLVAG